MMQYIWLAFVILFVVAEGMTVGLVSIWFAGGSLVAMLLAMAGAGIGWQMLAFLIVSAGLLMATRPLAKKYINSKKEKLIIKVLSVKWQRSRQPLIIIIRPVLPLQTAKNGRPVPQRIPLLLKRTLWLR